MSLHIVLFEPEIARNTGNIMRTCVAVGAALHLIEPLGFDLHDKRLRRSATYHMPLTDYRLYSSFEEFAAQNPGAYFLMSRHGQKAPSMVDFTAHRDEEIYLIFGKESTGLPHELLDAYRDSTFRLPMTLGTKSLNVSNAVCVCAYEVMRQLDYPGLELSDSSVDEHFRESFDDFSR